MSTVGNIIQRVQSLYSKGADSQSTRLMRRHIYDKMLSARAVLIFNKINKKQFLSKWNYDILPCIELTKVDQNDCPCKVAPGCQILRSKYKLPKPLNSINSYLIDSVMSTNGAQQFHEVSYKEKNWRKYDKYTSRKPDFFIKDDYLYITSTRTLKSVTLIGAFNDPIEVTNYPSGCDVVSEETCPTFPMDIDFPIDEEQIDALIELTGKELGISFQPSEDVRNDARDKVIPPRNAK